MHYMSKNVTRFYSRSIGHGHQTPRPQLDFELGGGGGTKGNYYFLGTKNLKIRNKKSRRRGKFFLT